MLYRSSGNSFKSEHGKPIFNTFGITPTQIAASPLPPETAKEQVTTLQERRPTGICPCAPLQHLRLWPANRRLPKVCLCWRSSNHTCWWRLAGSGSGVEQRHGNARWIPPDLEASAQHHKNGVGSLPPQHGS